MTKADNLNSAELTSEKRLCEIYHKSRKIPMSKFNLWSTLIVMVSLSINVWISNQSIGDMLDIIRKSAENGLSISLNTLGFLIAGFTVFATLSSPDLSLEMANHTHSESGLSYLKYNYFVLLRVFVHFIIFAGFCLAIVMYGHKNGLVSSLIASVILKYPKLSFLRDCLVEISYVLIYTGYYFLLVQLKSFIFNIYHIVMTSLRWKAEQGTVSDSAHIE